MKNPVKLISIKLGAPPVSRLRYEFHDAVFRGKLFKSVFRVPLAELLDHAAKYSNDLTVS